MATNEIDLTNAPTLVMSLGNEHDRLAAFAGAWTGVARTWLDPKQPPSENPFSGTAKLVLGGRFLRFEYRTELDGTPIAGELILGYERDEGRWATAWIDSFHTGSCILSSHGLPKDTVISVFGEYFVKGAEERWGWRTVFDESEGFRIRMYNVSPERQEDLGVEIVLKSGKKAKAKKRKAAKK